MSKRGWIVLFAVVAMVIGGPLQFAARPAVAAPLSLTKALPVPIARTSVAETLPGDDLCKSCVLVLERVQKEANLLLPTVCSELYMNLPEAYTTCHQVLNALSLNGNNLRYWLFEGCYKYEGGLPTNKPCPSTLICEILQQLARLQDCAPETNPDPF